MSEISNIVAILTGTLSLASYIPYILSTVRRETTPNRATWFIWFVSGIIICFSYFESGATYQQLWLPVSYAIGQGVVAFLSIKYGEGGWSPLDRFSITCSGISLLLWYFLNSPEIALIMNVSIDFFGTIPTIKKSYQRPWSENKLAWFLVFLAATLNLFTISSLRFILILYPLYMFIANGIITLFVFNFQKMQKIPVVK